MGDMSFSDSMILDGLMDAFHDYHMGITAENIATKWQISRDEQDNLPCGPRTRRKQRRKAGKFADEIVPVLVKSRRDEVTVDQDEYIKPGVDLASLQNCALPFQRRVLLPPATPLESMMGPRLFC